MSAKEQDYSTSSLRAVIKCVLFVSIILLMFVPVLLLWGFHMEKLRGQAVRFFFATIGRISGVRLRVEGTVSDLRPLMLVANHTSYLDIFVLGSLLPLSFTPKIEIRSWPIIGFFCVLADCVFIERRPTDMQRAQEEMAARLNTGKVLGLFPEGTTGDGFHVMPFKSGFLSLVEDHDLPLQPVSLAYTHIGKTPLNANNRDKVAWIGEASFVSHFWHLLKFPNVNVVATLYEVERIANYEDRKQLAKQCETIIRVGLMQTLEANGVTS
ncbi:MAG: lysophospholipid acyltransferase family protein [Rickettsiales bacterium]